MWTTYPPKTMNRTMTPGPMASAASVLGAKEPTASPRDVDAKLSSVRIPQNLANLQQPQMSLPQRLVNPVRPRRVCSQLPTPHKPRVLSQDA